MNFRTGAQLKTAIEEGGKSCAAQSLLLFGLGAAAGPEISRNLKPDHDL